MTDKTQTEEKKVNEDASVGDKYAPLRSFVDNIINKNHDAAKSVLQDYIKDKSREILGTKVVQEEVSKEDPKDDDVDEEDSDKFLKNRDKKKRPLKKMKRTNEAVLREFMGDSPIKLKGDGVFVNGKEVGTIENDLASDSGIMFHSADGRVSKEFETMKELYTFLVTFFKVKGETPLEPGEE